MTKCSEELEKTEKIAFFTTFSQMSLTPELEFFQTCGFHRIMPAIKLHYSKVFPEKIVKQFSVKFEKPPKMALFTTFSGKTLKVICQVKRPKYEKTIRTLLKELSLDFLKIQTDFDLDHPFQRYSCFKRPTKFGTSATFPEFWENQIFPGHAVCAKMSSTIISFV